jgi:hypothetical protein
MLRDLIKSYSGIEVFYDYFIHGDLEIVYPFRISKYARFRVD